MNVKLDGNSLVIPKSIMEKFNLQPGSELNLTTGEDSIELKIKK